MSEKPITHNNHYVPQFYLRNWSVDEKQIFVYRLLVSDSQVPYWCPKNIKSTAVWNDFYTRNNGEAEVDDFEKWFNSEFESPVHKVLDNLKNGDSLNTQNAKILSRYVAAQYLRTPARLNDLLEQWCSEEPSLVTDVLQNTFKKLETGQLGADNQIQISEQDKLLPIRASIENDIGQVKVEWLVGKGSYLHALWYLLTKSISINAMERHKWYILHAAEGISFPTSDDPVVCLNFRSEVDYNFKGGWGKKNGNIIMPISPKHLFITQTRCDGNFTKFDYSEHWSRFFRKIIIEHAYRYVYAIERQNGMRAIKPRMVDAELYAKEKTIMAGWHDEQMKAESQFRSPK